MKLRGGKKVDARSAGRQRRQSDWQAPAAFSYHAQRAQRVDTPNRQTPSLADQRHRLLTVRFWAKRSGLLIALIIAVICLFSIASLSSSPRVIFLDQQNGAAAFHDTKQYEAAAQQYLGSSFWHKNKITINTNDAGADLQKRYPELAEVSVSLPLVGHRPIYYLRSNPPTMVLQAVNGTYVLDSAGTVLIAKDKAPSTVTGSLPVLADQTGLQAQVGKQVISSAQSAFIKTVIDTLAAKQVTVSSLILPANAVQELDIRVEGRPYTIKFNMHEDKAARQQVGTYLATDNNLKSQNIMPSQYIDVRVPGRAYYL
jgi:hypothetical protein